MTVVTMAMLDAVSIKLADQGFDMRHYTAHKVAHELMRWHPAFKRADYAQLVDAIREWHRNR